MIESILNWPESIHGFESTISSIVLLVALLIFRWGATYRIRQWNLRSPELRRKWMVQVRNWTLLLFLLGLIVIWARHRPKFSGDQSLRGRPGAYGDPVHRKCRDDPQFYFFTVSCHE